MRILYITPFVPWPIRVRSFNLIPRLARRHEIYLLCAAWSAEEEGRAEILRGMCNQVRSVRHAEARAFLQCAAALPTAKPLRMAYFASSRMKAAVRQAVAEFSPDVIYAERWRALEYVPPGLGVPVLADPTDSMLLYNQRLMRAGRWWERLVGCEEYLKFLRYETKLARRADAVVFCSEHDLAPVRRYAPEVSYVLVPNGVDTEKFFFKQPGEEQSNTLVFTGNLGYGPNRHATRFFLEKIFPHVRREIPETKFVVVGRDAKAYFQREAERTPGLEVVDFVPDLRTYIARATVAVAPITIGVGVSNKLGEAFATGTPVVATWLPCGDMAVQDGVHLLIADEPREFAARVVRLLRKPKLRASLAARARRLVEERYDWGIVCRTMERTMLELAEGRLAPQKGWVAAAV